MDKFKQNTFKEVAVLGTIFAVLNAFISDNSNFKV